MKHEIRTSKWYYAGMEDGRKNFRADKIYIPLKIRDSITGVLATAAYLHGYADGIQAAMHEEFWPEPEKEEEPDSDPEDNQPGPGVAEVVEFYG